MLLTEADLTAQTGVLAEPVAALALQVLLLDHLAGGLVLKLIVLTERLGAEAAGEATAPMVPHASLTLNTLGISEGASTCVFAQALLAMAHPGLTEITNSSDHGHARGVAGVLDYTVTNSHALLLATLGTLRQPLHALAEVAEGSVLLPPLANITLHGEVARPLCDVKLLPRPKHPDLLLLLFHLVSLLPGRRLLQAARHLGKKGFAVQPAHLDTM